MRQLLIAGLGGFIGSACRLWLSTVTYRICGQDFPYGTLFVNVTGSLLIGFLMAIFEERFLVSPNFRIFLTIGVLGGFTTFSTFSFETISLFQQGNFLSAAANILYSLFFCLGATWIGTVLGKLL